MSERAKAIERMLKAEGVTATLVDIGREDDVPWAKVRVGSVLRTLVASNADSDEAAVAEMVIQARKFGIL